MEFKMIDSAQVLANANCPVIEDGSEVIVTNIYNFTNANCQFVTIRDLHRVNLDFHGNPQPILSTIRLTDETFRKD